MAVEEEENWFLISGHEDMQYLIFQDENDAYSLWKFESFSSQSYPFSDVLEIIYNIHSAADIKEIVSNPATMDNTEEGKAIQDEIGTLVISEAVDINEIYTILSQLTCYGADQWDMIGLNQESMQNQVKLGRYLTLVTSQGMEIDTLKYTGITGTFYEYGGIAYNPLEHEQKTQIEELLKIEPLSRNTGSDVSQDAGNTASDVPVDEATYQEAREYADDIMDLQNRISKAMTNGELPFVVSSAIYENPDRLHVVVTTEEEDLICKLKAYDTTGTLLEIEYRTNDEEDLTFPIRLSMSGGASPL